MDPTSATLDDAVRQAVAPPAAPKADSSFDNLVKEAADLRADTREVGDTLKENAKLRTSIASQIASLKPPEPPKIEVPVKPPGEIPETNPLQAFGSPASWLAVFGGFLTKRPLTASLDASASAMEAYRKRDLESYDLHLKNWKAQSEFALRTQEYQQTLYRNAMEQHKGNLDQLQASMSAIAAANQDVVMQHTLRSGDFKLAEGLYHDRQAQLDRFEQTRERLARDAETHRHNLVMEGTPERNAYEKYKQEHPEATAEDLARFQQTLKKSGAAALKPEQIAFSRWLTEHPEATADEVIQKAKEMQAMAGKKTPQMVALEKFIEDNPDADAMEIQKFLVGFKEDAPGVAARKDRKIDLDEAAKKREAELKDRGLDIKEAQIAAQAGHWDKQDEIGARKADQGDVKLGQADRRLDQIDEKILNDREVKADLLELKGRGLSLAEQNAVALQRWRERQGDLRERQVDITQDRVANDALYKDEYLKLRERGLSDARAKEEALERYRDRALVVRQETAGAKKEAAAKQTDKLLSQADDLLGQIEKNPNVVGGRGLVAGGVQTLKGMINPRAKVDESYQQWETSLKAFRTEVNLAISQSKYYSAARMAEMAKTLPGLERFQSAQDARTAIETMKSLLAGAKLELGEAPGAAPDAPTQADLEFTAQKYGLPIEEVKKRLGLP